MKIKRHVMIVDAPYYKDVSAMLMAGVKAVLSKHDISYERLAVPGALEIPSAIRTATMRRHKDPIDAYIALGCVIRGETSHYDIVAQESCRGLMDLGVRAGVSIGNGILTCNTKEQALERADPSKKNKGGEAARAALLLLAIKEEFGVV